MEVRRKSLAVLLGVAIAGIVGASAASLSLTSSGVGADTDVVAACDKVGGIQASYTTSYSTTNQQYEVTKVTLDGVDADCNGKAVEIKLTTTTPAAAVLATVSSTVSTGSNTYTLSAPISAEALEGIAVLING